MDHIASDRPLCKRSCRCSGLQPKIFAFLFLYIWVRGTLPRFRYDQLMAFGWKFLLPLAIANLVITALIVALRA